ncbi:hypothetical protein ACTNB0_06350 [Lachnospiraceae bacterium HCP28S3_F9]
MKNNGTASLNHGYKILGNRAECIATIIKDKIYLEISNVILYFIGSLPSFIFDFTPLFYPE